MAKCWGGADKVTCRPQRKRLSRGHALAAAFAAPIRVHHAPALIGIYRWLLSEGVTLIGANDLTHTQVILQGLSGQER
jgi:hypothetical protein